ncbi:MAG: hypothetical protein WC498_03460 [Candidatus Saccharimonadales bacterium]
MFPNQDPNQAPGQPQQPYVPPQPTQQPIQAPNGQYEVVPPPTPMQNPSGHNPYEFIVNPNTPKKSGLKLFGGNKFLQQIAFLVGGAVLLIATAAIIISVAFPGNSSKTDLITIAQKQQELVRIATLGAAQATDQTAKNFSTSTELSVATSQQQVLGYLGKHNTKVGSKELSLTKSAQTDTLLANAQANSTFNSIIEQTLVTQLTSYRTLLKQTFNKTSNTTVKTLLNQNYQAAGLLLEQGQAAAAQTTSS